MNTVKHLIKGFWRFGLAILVLLLLIYIYIHYRLVYPSTNDATVNANIVAVSSKVTGMINAINVKNNQYVKKNEVLFTINPRLFKLAVQIAQQNFIQVQQKTISMHEQIAADQAKFTNLQVSAALSEKEKIRLDTLLKRKVTSQESIDKAASDLQQKQALLNQQQHIIAKDQAILQQLNAQMRGAKASLQIAMFNLKYTKINAPDDGYLTNFTLQIGNAVLANQPLFGLIKTDIIWVSANLLETELRNVRPGQSAIIKLLMYPDQSFKGRVQSIGVGITTDRQAANVLLPYVKPTINWIRLAQRFPVKVIFISPNPKYPLRVGANARVTINTTS